MEKVIIFGIGDISQIAYLYLSENKNYEIVAFTIDKEYIKEDTFLGLPVVAFENLEDEEFVEYINEIIKDFPEYDFKALYFDKNSIKEIKNKFQHSNLNLIELKSAKDIFENLEVYLSNYEKTFKDRFEMPIMNLLRYKSNDIALLPLGLNRDKYLTLREFENQNKAYFQKLLNNLEYLGFNKDVIDKYGNSFNAISFKSYSEKYNIDINFNLDESTRIAYIYYHLKLGYKNHNYFEEIINRIKKIIEVQK